MMDQTPRSLHISSSVLRLAAIAALTALTVVGQTRVFPSNNSNSARRNHIATIHSADSTEGSRVSIVSDQSLNEYEAYRRGDRFYVKIPASDVPRAQAMRGRGFTDVTAQRNGDNTILSFRLIPGATAHVEQHGNRLEIVIAVVGGGQTTASNRSRDFVWSDTSGRPRAGGAVGNNTAAPGTRIGNAAGSNANKRGNQSSAVNKNSSARDSAANASANANSKSKNSNSNSASGANKNDAANSSPGGNNPGNTNSAGGSNLTSGASSPSGSMTSSPTGSMSSSPSPFTSPPYGTNGSSLQQQTSTPPSSGTQTSSTGSTTARSDFWSRAKERGHYWLLLAQLNPIPVAVGAAILILIVALFFVQRRRAKATRRVNRISKSKVRATESASSKAVGSAVPLEAAAVVAAAPAVKTSDEMTETTRLASAPAEAAASPNGKPERMNRAAEEANKIFAGQPYDESVVGSTDRETRRMVGAELLSAMVGRNIERRDRARTAFMKHGYFDDATRDLRVAGSDNERAAAARRLSFTQDAEATPHLVGALNDPSPDVRRASVEALTDLRDPAAIAPLNNLLQTERDRRVPRHLIEQAIDACATNSQPSSVAASVAPPPPVATDREVIEI